MIFIAVFGGRREAGTRSADNTALDHYHRVFDNLRAVGIAGNINSPHQTRETSPAVKLVFMRFARISEPRLISWVATQLFRRFFLAIDGFGLFKQEGGLLRQAIAQAGGPGHCVCQLDCIIISATSTNAASHVDSSSLRKMYRRRIASTLASSRRPSIR